MQQLPVAGQGVRLQPQSTCRCASGTPEPGVCMISVESRQR